MPAPSEAKAQTGWSDRQNVSPIHQAVEDRYRGL